MILYTLNQGTFRDLSMSQDSSKKIHEKFYVNLTNKCPCSCTFCLRQTKKMLEEHTLWLKHDVSFDEFKVELDKYDISDVPEVIFCGFGEPTECIDTLLQCASYIKEKNNSITIRLNTNGLGNLIHNKDITPLLQNKIDIVSISLNAPTKEEYLALTRNRFGMESFDAMLDFAKKAEKYVTTVILSVVDVIGEDKIKQCQDITNSLGITLRVRVYEE